jgi:hypothetical protein
LRSPNITSPERAAEIRALVSSASFRLFSRSAKHAVEIAIEQDEKAALESLEK